MSEQYNNATQHGYHPFQLWKKWITHEEDPDPPASDSELHGAVRALDSPLGVGWRKGQDVDAELDAGKYPHSHRRQYRVHLPPDYNPSVPAPMIMVLHGCHQTHLDIQRISRFDAIADREGAIVVYPWVTGYSGMRTINCWGWWMRGHRKRGQGEVEDLARIARDVTSRYAIDPERRYICGLSSGACMSVVSLVAASDTWTAGASVAGVPYGEDARAIRISRFLSPRFRPQLQLLRSLQLVLGHTPPPPLLIVQSTTDEVVSLPNAEHLRDQWLSASAMSALADCHLSGDTMSRAWQLQGHHDQEGRLQTLYFKIENLIHGWFGGESGDYSTHDAPNLSELIWWFFLQHSANRS